MKRNKKFILFLICCIGFISSFMYIYRTLFTNDIHIETKVTVMIDPGHGGYDPGSVGLDGTCEKDIALSIAMQTGKMIQQMDPRIRVVYTRSSDTVSWPDDEAQDLYARVAMAQNQQVDYYIAIHCDSAQNDQATGYSFYIREGDSISYQCAQAMDANLSKVHWSNSLGIKYTFERPIYVVDNQSIPALLFETGYISNAAECAKMQAWYNQKLISYSLSKGIVDTISATFEH